MKRKIVSTNSVVANALNTKKTPTTERTLPWEVSSNPIVRTAIMEQSVEPDMKKRKQALWRQLRTAQAEWDTAVGAFLDAETKTPELRSRVEECKRKTSDIWRELTGRELINF